jgi:hypothetical protein|tara:strand:+ start:418 stop:627 length:210 start_codon:yes stop_codon:yes gene_type:complete
METVSLRDVLIISQIRGKKKVNVLDLAGIEVENQRNAENRFQDREETSPSVNHAKAIEAMKKMVLGATT